MDQQCCKSTRLAHTYIKISKLWSVNRYEPGISTDLLIRDDPRLDASRNQNQHYIDVEEKIVVVPVFLPDYQVVYYIKSSEEKKQDADTYDHDFCC